MSDKYKAYEPLFAILATVTTEANNEGNSYRAATKDASSVVDDILNTSDDATVVQFREFREKVNAKIQELQDRLAEATSSVTDHAKSLVPSVAEVDTAALKASYLEKRQAVTLTRKNILALLGGDETAFKAGIEAYGIVDVIGLSGTKTTGATGVIRKRLDSALVNGEPLTKKNGDLVKASFTALSQATGVDGGVIRDAAAKAANVDSVKDIPDAATVTFTVVNGDKSFDIEITTPDPTAEKSDTGSTESDDSSDD